MCFWASTSTKAFGTNSQTKFGAYIAIGGAMVTILINVIFIPTAGYMASAYATLIVYAGQTVASFLLSRKYFPIKYNIRKFFLYIGTALVLFFIGNAFQFENNILTYFMRNALIVFFMAMVWNLEKSSLKTQK
jgi:O-antigen/teichoic acid export membrane protein